MPGKVFLVGAGPGDPELLTLKALRVLKSADVVLHDALIGPEILALIPRNAISENVGKRCGMKSARQQDINQSLINYARLDLQVVRLKGGDPLIFGRCGEEIEALRQAGIDFDIVPGITAALGAAASAHIPLTHRDIASSLVILTSHRAKDGGPDSWPTPLPKNSTLVIYMPGQDYESVAQKLVDNGIATDTACAIVSQATSPEESVHVTTIERLAASPKLPTPNLLVVGAVAELADHRSLIAIAEEQDFFSQEYPHEGIEEQAKWQSK
ncbi:MAG TPA: uroporphyrinogen-III C-methyltransferase [Terriglobales bacterium]|jgi:uroporphyrin-III C-methyltransferase|nr:uroporphyrinogen-III C-methyltransferase [Terriglobales bacterium]